MKSDSSALYVNNQHQLNIAVQRNSPNCDERPESCTACLLVIHNITLPLGDMCVEHIDALFCDALDCELHPSFHDLKDLHVSAHLLICRDGSVNQYVPFNKRAWHAGISSWNGRLSCNDYSIGIELQGTDTLAYEPAQYSTLTNVVEALLRRYPELSLSQIVGHQEIAPGRKTDPGRSFDWPRLYRALGAG